MLNWWLIAILTVFTLVGFFYLDEKVLVFAKKIHKKSHLLVDHFFRASSFTPLVITVLYVIPGIFVYLYLDFFSIIVLTFAGLFATGLAFAMKYIFKRMRPFGHTTYLGKIDSAFPSAHTAGSFVTAFTLSFFWPEWSILFFAPACLVAISRIYLELHFFSDVMGGVLLAYLMAVFTLDSQVLFFLGF